MMRRAIIVLAMATLPTFVQSANVAWVTGERLLERLTPIDPAHVPWTPGGVFSSRQLVAEHRTIMNREFVEGYLYAIHDASEGKDWCFNEKYQIPNGETFWNETVWGLRALPAAQLKQNASDLLREIWGKKWPCPADHRRQK